MPFFFLWGIIYQLCLALHMYVYDMLVRNAGCVDLYVRIWGGVFRCRYFECFRGISGCDQ